MILTMKQHYDENTLIIAFHFIMNINFIIVIKKAMQAVKLCR